MQSKPGFEVIESTSVMSVMLRDKNSNNNNNHSSNNGDYNNEYAHKGKLERGVHWSKKPVVQMTERDWRIFKVRPSPGVLCV